MMTLATKEQIAAWKKRPFSWSQLSAWEYSPEEWFARYVLGIPERETPELIFGKKFADAAELRKPLAPITLLEKMEKPLSAKLGTLELVGYADTHGKKGSDGEPGCFFGEYKTGVKPWDQKRVDEHGQLTMYALMHYLEEAVKPEEMRFFLEWVPTVRVDRHNGDMQGFDYDIEFASNPPEVVPFETKRTMLEVMQFASRVKAARKAMKEYVASR